VTSPTNTRTTIACLLPPSVAITEAAPTLVRRRGNEKTDAFLLGVMSSIPFDWATRRWTELHLKFYILNAMPVPSYESRDEICSRVVDISGRLAAVDERYSSWAARVGVAVGSVTAPAEKDDLIAELDALVSLLYGLTENQVEHLFATFHRGWKYEPRLEAVMQHYRTWKGKA
jgi:hypothetical protein